MLRGRTSIRVVATVVIVVALGLGNQLGHQLGLVAESAAGNAYRDGVACD